MLPNRHPLVLAISLAALPLAQSHAQNAGTAQLPTTVISASALAQSATQMVSASEVLEGSQLLLQRQATLGDTVKNIPGVRGSSFGAGASRPVIRGMDGARVRVLSDGVGMLDASTLSADHAVTTEPLLLERIEVLKGPATLLYGGGAIGGVVNLIDKKIPTQQPENGHQVDLEWQGNTVAKESTAIAGATLGLEDFALRVEGLKRDADPYRLAGHEDGSRSKKQTGSYNDTSTGTLGLSWIGDEGYLGVAYTRQANEYGLLAHEEVIATPTGMAQHCTGIAAATAVDTTMIMITAHLILIWCKNVGMYAVNITILLLDLAWLNYAWRTAIISTKKLKVRMSRHALIIKPLTRV